MDTNTARPQHDLQQLRKQLDEAIQRCVSLEGTLNFRSTENAALRQVLREELDRSLQANAQVRSLHAELITTRANTRICADRFAQEMERSRQTTLRIEAWHAELQTAEAEMDRQIRHLDNLRRPSFNLHDLYYQLGITTSIMLVVYLFLVMYSYPVLHHSAEVLLLGKVLRVLEGILMGLEVVVSVVLWVEEGLPRGGGE